LCKDLLYHNQYIPTGTVISDTNSASNFYKDMVHPSCIHDKYSDELGQQVITQHTDAVRKYNNQDVDAPDATII